MKIAQIPQIFFNSKTNSPFEECLICNKKLLQVGCEYVVMKSYRYYKEFNKKDVTYELALCYKCHEMLYESFSEESLARLNTYWENHFKYSRQRKLMDSNNYNLDEWISCCACKAIEWNNTTSFHIYGDFVSDKMKFEAPFPYMLSEEVFDDIVNLLSNHTIDSLTKLFEIYIDFPPQFKSIFSKSIIHK